LFIPVALGGLGQEFPVGFSVKITDFQRDLAQDLHDRSPWVDFKFGPHWETPPPPVMASVPWAKDFAPGKYDLAGEAKLRIEAVRSKMGRREGQRLRPFLVAVCGCCATEFSGDSCPSCLVPFFRCSESEMWLQRHLGRYAAECSCHGVVGHVAEKTAKVKLSRAYILGSTAGTVVLRRMHEGLVVNLSKKRCSATIGGDDFVAGIIQQSLAQAGHLPEEVADQLRESLESLAPFSNA
jgi:Zn-finger protein